ncbi:MAG: RNA polymerase sigma factor [Gemmatimonadaceae bacterium]
MQSTENLQDATEPDTVWRDAAWHAAIVARVLAGDTGAYGQLVALYRPRCLRYARRMLGEQDDAEDVAQEAFVRAFRSLARCEDPGRFGAWLFSILVNRCRTALEKRSRWDRLLARDMENAEAWIQPEVEGTGAEISFSLEQVEAALQQLSTEQREAFLLKHVEEMSYEEMSMLTGTGVSALKMRVSRARDLLRTKLAEVRNG